LRPLWIVPRDWFNFPIKSSRKTTSVRFIPSSEHYPLSFNSFNITSDFSRATRISSNSL
jgi:hypothetical protein